MKQYFSEIELSTKQQFEVLDISGFVKEAIEKSGVKEGVAVITTPHTTAAIRLNHFEPLLIQDLFNTTYSLVPMTKSYSHDLFELRQNISAQERSNGHAHVKAFLLGTSETLVISDSAPLLGKFQNILFVELDGGRQRRFYIKIIGE